MPTPPNFSGGPKGRVLLLTASLLATPLLSLTGCDSDTAQADRRVDQSIRDSQTKREEGNLASSAASLNALDQAARETNASPSKKILAKALLAQAELDSARTQLLDIDHWEMDVRRLINQISQLGNQVASANTLVDGYKKLDPDPARKAIADKITEAQGSPDKPIWFDAKGAPIPTLSAVRQDISQLQGEIARNQDQAKSLADQRTKVLDDADKFSRQAETEKSQAAVDLFKQAADARKKAADLDNQVDNINAALVPLQQKLSVAQAQEGIVSEAIKQLQEQAQQVDSAWADIQKQTRAQVDLAKAILQGATDSPEPATTAPSAPAGGSITEKASELAKLTTQVEQARQTAEQNLSSSAKHFEDAARAANEYNAELSSHIQTAPPTSPDITAWTGLKNVTDAATLKSLQATAVQTLAALHAARSSELAARLAMTEFLAPVIEKAGLLVPKDLDDSGLSAQLKTQRDLADQRYKESADLYTTVAEMPALNSKPDQQNSARLARMLALYSWSQLAADSGNKDQSTEHLRDAIAARDELVQRSAQFPVLPTELQPPPPAPTTAPASTTEPTTAPTTAPIAPSAPPVNPA